MDKRLLSKQLDYTLTNSHFYRRKLNDYLQIQYNPVDSFDQFPLTTKRELLEDQENNPPFGSNLCVQVKEIKRIHKTSGTTQKPLLITLTETDILKTIKTGASSFKLAGLKSKDIVVHCLNYNMWAGGYTDHQSLETTGAAVIPFGVGNTENLIKTILTIKPTAIHCTPSYLSKIELCLNESFQMQPVDLKLKLGLFGGEAGIQNSKFRKKIEEIWGLKAMNANYGLSEVLSIFGSECKYQKGLHFTGNEFLYPEIINPDTMEKLQLETGSCGELILTNLSKEAQPLLRYRTNDIIRIISTDKCSCGKKSFRFEIVGRSDDMLVIRGINVFITAIDNIIAKELKYFSPVYQILVNKSTPIDRIIIKLEKKTYTKIDNEHLVNILQKDFKQNLSITPEFDIVNEGELPRVDGKSKKLFKIL